MRNVPSANNFPQDRQRRLIPKANRHHLPRQADWRQGHKRQGQGHHRGLNGLKKFVYGDMREEVGLFLRIIGCVDGTIE